MGKEHCGEESNYCDEDCEEEGESTLTLDCRKRHDAGVDGEFHVLVRIVLYVEFVDVDYIFDVKFADENCKYYTYVLAGEGYEGVGDGTQLILQLVS